MRRCGICVLIIGSIALMTVSLTVQSATPQNPSQELTNVEGLLGRQAEKGRLQRPDLNELLMRLLHATHTKQDTGLITPSAVGVTGFTQYVYQTGLTGVSGFGFNEDPYGGATFTSCSYYAESTANRVSYGCGGTVTPFATGLSAPVDLVFTPSAFGPFGNYLYVTEPGANRISRIGPTGTVTPFATFTAAPKRMAFSPSFSSFTPDFLYVTLADGRIVKVNANGTVSPCAGGLSGPEGLVFGPGGWAYKNVLFVAEATANRISKVTSACTVIPFVSSGLSSPGGLEISPGGAWGPVDTLYVTNGPSQVSRINGAGVVSLFTSGFASVHTLRFLNTYTYDRLGYAYLSVSDSFSGSVSIMESGHPSAYLTMTGCNPCTAGQTFSMTADIVNASPLDLPVEIKAWFRFLDGTPLTIAPLLGHNRHFEIVMPSGFSFSGQWLNFTMPPLTPGNYCYQLHLLDPEGGFYTGTESCFDVLP